MADRRFACTTNADCAEGFLCGAAGACVAFGGTGGGTGGGGENDAGADAGDDAGQDAGGDAGSDAGSDAGPLDAGADAGFDAGSDGGTDGGGDAGAFTLAFTTSPQTINAGSCSAPVQFEVRRGGVATPVPSATAVTLTDAPSGTLGLFTGAGCLDAGAQLALAAGASNGSFSFFGGDAGGFTLSLSAPGLTGGGQPASVVFPPATGLVFTTAPQTVRAGDCSAVVTVELRDAANGPARASIDTPVALSASPAPGVVFYSDSACTNVVNQVTVLTGASRGSFYVSSVTGQAYTLTATLGVGMSALRAHTILPVVRTGSCVIPDGGFWVSCPVSPPQSQLADSFLLFQVGGVSDSAGSLTVRCQLTSASTVACSRLNNDSYALINWQSAEVKGAVVQWVEATNDGGTPSLALATAAPPATSFVLTSQSNDGDNVNDNDFNIARLNAAGTGVDFDFGPGGGAVVRVLAQVVTLPNTAVDRGAASIPASAPASVVADPPQPLAPVLLAQWRQPLNSVGMCDRLLRPELSLTDVLFARGDGSGLAFCTTSALADIFWERINFKTSATVQQQTFTLGAAAGTANLTLALAVDRTRTLLFTGGQGSLGQAFGETQLSAQNNATGDYFGDAAASFTFGGTGAITSAVTASRESRQAAAKWTLYVVQLNP